MNSSKNPCEGRLKNFKLLLLSWKSEQEIFNLYEKCHTPTQVICLFRHQFLDESGDKLSCLSNLSLAKMLKKIVPYSKDQHKKHLKMPQWWKIRFCHLDKSEEDVKLLVEKQLKQWAANSHELRRRKESYTPKQSLQYWTDTGLSGEDAQKALLNFKRSCSPFAVEFWEKKGLSREASREKVSSMHKKGGIASCASQNKKTVSSLENEIFKKLSTCTSRFLIQQHCIDGTFVYDICDVKSKKIIEVNGTYWHADPRVYALDDMLVCNGLTAKAVRERDNAKHLHAEKFGYALLVVWEIDWHSAKEDTIQKMIKFLEKEC